MTDRMLHLYHLMPPAGRTLLASMRGFQLRQRRYGRETERLVEAALERDTWSPDQWRMRTEERLSRILHHAATRVPFYRAYWEEQRRRGDSRSWEILAHWPVLEKESLRSCPGAFVTDSNTRHLHRDSTSGTSGKPLEIWSSSATLREWYGLYEARCRRWNDVSREDRWAILGGQLVAPASQKAPPFWVWNAGLRQLYLSSTHLSLERASDYWQALRQYRVTHLVGYPSSLAVLAQGAPEWVRSRVPLKVTLTNAEPLPPARRRLMEQSMPGVIRETYGMAEMVAAGSECANGSLHGWPDAGFIEVLDGDEQASDGVTGDLVCTGLLNQDMPLIRYRVGDRAARPSWNVRCGCGKTLPILNPIEGRVSDTLVATDGRRVFWLNPVLYDLPIEEAQIVQDRLDLIQVLYVPTREFSSGSSRLLTQRVQARLGDVEVRLQPVTRIPRAANGKFKPVVCNLSEAQALSAEGVR